MTIQSTTARVSFNCDGVTKVFPVNIQSYQANDFDVWLTTAAGVATLLVLNSNYSLVQVGTLSPQAWSLTTLAASAYATGNTLQVIVDPLRVQQTTYPQGIAFPSLAVQTNLDRLTQMLLRVEDQELRSLRAPDGDVAAWPVLPSASARAGLALVFDNSGLPSLGVANAPKILTFADTGAVNALAAAGAGLATALTAGLLINVTVAFTNTGACTFNYNGLGAVALLNTDNSPMNQGQLSAGSVFQFYYTGSVWQLFGDNIQGPTIFETAAAAAITNGYFSPLLYLDARRYGDDPNGTFDSTTAIQAAINVALQNSQAGGIVWLPQGTHKITATLNIPGSISIQGSSKGATIIYAVGFAQDQPMLNYQGGSGSTNPISGISQAASAVVTISTVAVQNPISVGQKLAFAGIVGMTQMNGLSGTVTAVGGSSGAWTMTVNINSSAFTAYGSGGTINAGARITSIFLRDVALQSNNGLARAISAAWVIYSTFDNVYYYQVFNGFVGNTCFGNRHANSGSFQVGNDNFLFLQQCNNVHFDKCRFTGINGVHVVGQNDTLVFTAPDFEGIVASQYNLTAITKAASAVFTINTVSTTNPIVVGDIVNFSGVGGMTQINGLTGTVSAIGGASGAWTGTVNINSSGFSVYTSGGILSDANGAGINLAPVTGTICYNVAVTGGHWENINGQAIKKNGADAGSVRGVTVKGSYITGGFATAGNWGAVSAIQLANVYGFEYDTNHFFDWSTNVFLTNNTEFFGRIANNTGSITNLASSGFRSQTLRENNQMGDRQIYFGTANPLASAVPATQGDIYWAQLPGAGGYLGFVALTTGATPNWTPLGLAASVSADVGDTGITLTAGSNSWTMVWNTPLTAARAVTLSTTGAYNGAKFRIVRTAAATGAFNLNVGTGPLKALTAAAQWCEVEYNGATAAWMETASGSL